MEADRYCYTPFGMPLEDDDLVGLNCYLPDMAVSDSPTEKTHQVGNPANWSLSFPVSRFPAAGR